MSNQIFTGIIILIILALCYYIFWQRRKYIKQLDDRNKTLLASRRIYQLILSDLEFNTVVQKIADTIPNELKFGTGVVAILDDSRGIIKRIGASRTKEAQEAIQALSVPFEKIEISINDPNNLMAKSLREHKPFITSEVYDVLGPVLSKEESLKIQTIMGTKTTLVYPIFLKDKPLGVFLASTKKPKDQLSQYELYIIDDFVNLVGLVLQNSQLYTSLKETKDALTHVNAQVSQMNQQLQDLDRLKDDFVSIASHELRTPMTAIRSYAWMALNRSDTTLTDKMKRYLGRTLISTERLINLVNDMLNISRIESGRVPIVPKVFDIATLIHDILYEIDAKAKEKNQHIIFKGNSCPKIFADADKVHQILLNLVGNAMKFTPNDGIISISCFADGEMLSVSVKDNGTGISHDDMSRLFKKFSRLDNSYVAAATSGGTGLGLYICKSLIELMGGSIKAYSEGINQGSTFTFWLPMATPKNISHPEKYTQTVKDGNSKNLESAVV